MQGPYFVESFLSKKAFRVFGVPDFLADLRASNRRTWLGAYAGPLRTGSKYPMLEDAVPPAATDLLQGIRHFQEWVLGPFVLLPFWWLGWRQAEVAEGRGMNRLSKGYQEEDERPYHYPLCS